MARCPFYVPMDRLPSHTLKGSHSIDGHFLCLNVFGVPSSGSRSYPVVVCGLWFVLFKEQSQAPHEVTGKEETAYKTHPALLRAKWTSYGVHCDGKCRAERRIGKMQPG